MAKCRADRPADHRDARHAHRGAPALDRREVGAGGSHAAGVAVPRLPHVRDAHAAAAQAALADPGDRAERVRGAERLFDVLDMPTEKSLDRGTRVVDGFDDALAFDDVSFAYDDEPTCSQDITLHRAQGRCRRAGRAPAERGRARSSISSRASTSRRADAFCSTAWTRATSCSRRCARSPGS